jgi:hypothetical protein
VCLPKRYAEAERVSLSEGYFFFSDVFGRVEGAAPDNGEEEEASVACVETQYTNRKLDQCFPTVCGQAEGRRAETQHPYRKLD